MFLFYSTRSFIMSRKAPTPKEQPRRDKIRVLLQESNMSASEIESHLHDIYGLSVIDTIISR